MHCMVWYCMILSAIECYCVLLNGIASYGMVLHHIQWYCMVFNGSTCHCVLFNGIIMVLNVFFLFMVLYSMSGNCKVLHCVQCPMSTVPLHCMHSMVLHGFVCF